MGQFYKVKFIFDDLFQLSLVAVCVADDLFQSYHLWDFDVFPTTVGGCYTYISRSTLPYQLEGQSYEVILVFK